MDNGAEEDRERDGSTSSSTTWRTCSSTWRMPRIELNGEGEPVWLTPHLRDPQPEGERESCHTGTAIKHPWSDRVKPSFVIFDIQSRHSDAQVGVSECPDVKNYR